VVILCVCISLVTALLPIEQSLYVGDSDGNVCKIDIHCIAEGKYSSEMLHGSHNSKADIFVALHGKLDAHGFLSGHDTSSKDKQTKRNSISFMRGFESVPCILLMSIGVGYRELFTSKINKDACFMIWALPSLKNS